MRVMHAGLLCAALVIGTAACGGRTVAVETGTSPTEQVSLRFTNNASQPVSVYVVAGGSDIFVKEVAPNTTELLPVRGVAIGTTVRLRATTADGTRTYTRDDVTLSATTDWQVP